MHPEEVQYAKKVGRARATFERRRAESLARPGPALLAPRPRARFLDFDLYQTIGRLKNSATFDPDHEQVHRAIVDWDG
jgi:hypothetical protein